MFPRSPEFVWDTGHVVLFGALCAVLAAIGTSLVLAARRALLRIRHGRVASAAWCAEFGELPASVRACRHKITGEAPERLCEKAFDCRRCAEHELLEAKRGRLAARAPEASLRLGFDPSHRFYHRGHTWVRLEKNGTVTIGLDGIARRLLGAPETIDLAPPGARIEAHGTLGRVTTRGMRVRLLAPIDGTVVSVRGSGVGFKLRVRPDATLDIRHLLAGPEAKVWSLRELERVERALGSVGAAIALADGGELVADVGAKLPREAYDALLGETFLEA
jgi:hypothetical protein